MKALFRVGRVVFAALLVLEAAAQSSDPDGFVLDVDHDLSSIEIRAKAMGLPTTFRLEQFTAEVRMDGAEQDLSSAVFTFRYDSLSSGRSGRDRKVRRWLEADRYPEGRFEAREFVEIDGERYAVGELTMHGETREARFRYDIEADDGRWVVDAEASIDYRDWGLPILRVIFVKIHPELLISLRVEGVVEKVDD